MQAVQRQALESENIGGWEEDGGVLSEFAEPLSGETAPRTNMQVRWPAEPSRFDQPS